MQTAPAPAIGDVLATLAQVAVASTGFAGLLAAFRQARAGWIRIEAMALKSLLLASVGTFLFALAPLPMLLAGWPGERVWTALGAAQGLYLLWLYAIALLSVYRDRTRPRSRVLFHAILALSTAAALALLLGALGAYPMHGPALYCTGLLWLLLMATLQFLVQVFVMFGRR